MWPVGRLGGGRPAGPGPGASHYGGRGVVAAWAGLLLLGLQVWPGRLHPLPLPQQVDLKLRLEKLDVRMVPSAAGEGPGSQRPEESKEDREERVLAMLGIVGTILNLLVIIFVYVYTTI